MSTPIHSEQVHDPMAWVGSDFVSDEDLVYRLEPRTVRGLEEILDRVGGMPRDAIAREHVGHPDVDGPAREVYEELISGRGLVVVRGFPVEEHSVDEIEVLYWAWLSHFGRLVSNNSFGHRMVRVQQQVLPNGVQPARGTKSPDAADLFSLLWIHQAEQGGESQYSSGPAAHNMILATRPDVLPILYRGFPHHRRSEQPDDQPDVTPYDVPIFSNVDGRICINFTYSSILPALHELGRDMTPQEAEAIEILRGVLVRQQLEMRMQPGDAAMANNFAMCHSRSDFVDGPDPTRRRLLLRAWMEVPVEDRRLPLGREFFHMENAGGHLGYDPVPGREGRIAVNDYNNVDEDLANLFKAAQAKPRVD
jgi:Taurine catabolism dioxygenase TauD, TfdA family